MFVLHIVIWVVAYYLAPPRISLPQALRARCVIFAHAVFSCVLIINVLPCMFETCRGMWVHGAPGTHRRSRSEGRRCFPGSLFSLPNTNSTPLENYGEHMAPLAVHAQPLPLGLCIWRALDLQSQIIWMHCVSNIPSPVGLLVSGKVAAAAPIPPCCPCAWRTERSLLPIRQHSAERLLRHLPADSWGAHTEEYCTAPCWLIGGTHDTDRLWVRYLSLQGCRHFSYRFLGLFRKK